MSEQNEATSIDAILDGIHGVETPVVEEVKEEVAEEVEATEEGAETEEAAQEDSQDDDEQEEEETPAEEEKPKQKKTHGQREREKRLKAEQEFNEKIALLEKQNKELQDLVRKAITGEKDEEAAEEEEPLDPQTTKKLQSKIESIEFETFATRQDMRGAATVENWAQAKNDVLAAEAMSIMEKQYALGNRITEEQAIQEAAYEMFQVMAKKHKEGGKNGDFVDYIRTRHKLLTDKQPAAKPKVERPKVNMKEVEKLRASAGAPTNKSASSGAAEGDLDALMGQFHQQAKTSLIY